MGTRNLTAVLVNSTPVIAQYGQWDGYPSGQGRTALNFCRKYLKTQQGRDAFMEKAKRCRWENDTEVSEFNKSIGCEDGWMNMEQAAKYHAAFPYMNRDHGAKILHMVHDAPADETIVLTNSYDFAQNSLFCEYAYVVDLTSNRLEAYIGFQKEPLPEGERFSGLGRTDGGYYPVRFVKSWDLNKLPTFRDFERAIKKADRG